MFLLKARGYDNGFDGMKHSLSKAGASLQSNSAPHLNDSSKAHKRLLDLKETMNVTSTSSLHTPLTHSSGMVMDEQLRRSMPDLLDKLPSDRSKHYTDLNKVNTLPHKKKNKSKIVLPTPSPSFVSLNLVPRQPNQSPSPVKNSLSQSMNSAFSRVTPDNVSASDSTVYHDEREVFNRNDGVADEPVLDSSSDVLGQQVRPTTVSMATNVPQDGVSTNNYQVNV